MRTTSQGACRICKHAWSVPRTSVEPERITKLPNDVSVIEGLEPYCPACRSPRISWLLDQEQNETVIAQPERVPRRRVDPAETQAVLNKIIARLHASPRRTMRPGGPAN